MQNALWQAIYDFFTEVDAILGRAERFGGTNSAIAVPTFLAPTAKPPKPAAGVSPVRAAYPVSEELTTVRTQLRARLDVLKASIAERLTEREVYLALFPIVVYADELVQNRFVRGQTVTWPPLQKELFKIDDGGALFYDTLDDLLRKPETLPFIYEIFFYCLSDGFRGKHADNLAKVNEYKHKLTEKIPVPPVAQASGKGDATPLLSIERLPLSYYAVAAAAVVVAFVALYALASV
ncbi:MAG: DotU family type IV/VI secretion system protein [Polyangiaceae bacterium]